MASGHCRAQGWSSSVLAAEPLVPHAVILLAGAAASAAAVWLIAYAALSPALPEIRPIGRTGDHPEAGRLRDSGWRWSARRWEALRWTTVLLAGALVWAAGMDPLVPVIVAAGGPSLALHVRAERRRDHRRAAALAQFRGIAAALASGSGLVDALRRVVAAEGDELASRPLRRALREFAVGASLSDALRAASADAHPRTRTAFLTLAMGVDERLPIARLADLVDAVVERLTFDAQTEAEVRARTGGARLQIWAMALVVPGLAAYLAVTVPLVADVLTSDLGTHLLLPAAGALEIAGLLLARRALADVTA